jgi:hypothetical protein
VNLGGKASYGRHDLGHIRRRDWFACTQPKSRLPVKRIPTLLLSSALRTFPAGPEGSVKAKIREVDRLECHHVG